MSAAPLGPGSGVLISGLTGGKVSECLDGEGKEARAFWSPRQQIGRKIGADGPHEDRRARDPASHQRRSEGDPRHLQLGDQPDIRDHRLRAARRRRSEEHTSELQSPVHLVCRLLLEKKKQKEQAVLILTKKNKKPLNT